MATELSTAIISFVTGQGTLTASRYNFVTGEGTLVCEKLSFPLYAAYKITAISIKCGTAIIDKLKLRRIQ